MRIILNSDVIHTNRRWADGLPAHISGLCETVSAVGGILVLPRTVLFEDERHQASLDTSQALEIEKALTTLRGWKIGVPEIDVRKSMPTVGVVDAFRATGATVEIEEPILEDYQEAEKRASLHLAPHPPEASSDEMRDLIIWQVALRIAKRDGGALLVSRDEVHMHDRGSVEANAARLFRAKNFEQVTDLLAREGNESVRAALTAYLAEEKPKRSVRARVTDEAPAALRSGRSPIASRDHLPDALAASEKAFEGLDGRVLGYVAYLDSPSKSELSALLAKAGVPAERTKNVAERLVLGGLITDTGNHFLIRDRQAGEAAAAQVELEIIALLQEE